MKSVYFVVIFTTMAHPNQMKIIKLRSEESVHEYSFLHNSLVPQTYSKGGCVGAMRTCLLCNHFEELQTVLCEVELIINNKSLTQVYPKTIETPNHLLFGRQLLYSSNTTSTAVGNLTVLSSTTEKINRISNHFFGYVEKWICSKFTRDTTNIKIKYKLPKN